jgi:hypothetical protein
MPDSREVDKFWFADNSGVIALLFRTSTGRFGVIYHNPEEEAQQN